MGLPYQAEPQPLALEDFQKLLAQLQRSYQDKIAAAQASDDDGAMIQILGRELQEEVSRLVGQFHSMLSGAAPAEVLQLFEKRRGSRSPERLYDNTFCGLNLEMAVYDGDHDTLAALLKDPQFVLAADEVLKDGSVVKVRRELLKRSFHLTSQMAPKLYAIGDNCKATLDLKLDVDFYVHPGSGYAASAYIPTNEGKVCVLLSSAMIEKFDDEELSFVVGHQIGHLLFDHHRMPINVLLERAGDLLSPVHALRVYAWKRNAEISADRMGILCCQNYEAASRALFKLACGIPAERLSFHLREYVDGFRDLKHELIHGRQEELEDWYSSHGFTPVRLRALELFFKSKTFTWLLDREGGFFEDETLESEIREFVTLMEPHYLSEHNDVSQVVREFIFIGCHLVALAHGQETGPDLEGLASLLDPEIMQRALGKVDGAGEDAVWQAQREAAEELNRQLPPVNKLNLLKDLTIISYSIGGRLAEDQTDVLYRLSQLLKIQPEFIDRVLASAAGALD
jgi:uncharacterized tellurite resistance protein B-like protein